MTYVDPQFAKNNRRVRLRNLTFGQCMAIVGGVAVLVLGTYFVFSLL
jgi:hypothetical protein